MKKGEFKIRISSKVVKSSIVVGWVDSGLGIHAESGKYHITHLKSGKAYTRTKTLKEAKRIVKCLIESGIKWGLGEEELIDSLITRFGGRRLPKRKNGVGGSRVSKEIREGLIALIKEE